jgi:hypothetical protein
MRLSGAPKMRLSGTPQWIGGCHRGATESDREPHDATAWGLVNLGQARKS